MRRWALAVLLLAAAGPAAAGDEFLVNMRKADARVETEEKIEYYTRAVTAWTPSHGSALLAYCRFRRGEAHYYRGEFDRAEPDLSKAIELDPGNNRAYYYRGEIFLRQERFDRAIVDLQDYSLASKDAEGFWRLGQAYERAGQLLPAAKRFREAQAADAEDFHPLLGLARIAASQKKDAAAAAFFQKAEALAAGRSAEVYADRALFESRASRHDKAVDDFGRAVEIFEERLKHLKRSAADRPLEILDQREGLARSRFGRAQSREALRQWPDALADYEASCELGLAAACPKAQALRKPSEPVKRAPKKRYPKNNSGPGDRIYAN